MSSMDSGPRLLRKQVKGTNITIQKNVIDGVQDPHLALLYSIQSDDQTELQWFHQVLRPEKNLIHPSVGFLQAIKALRPAPQFTTFDVKKSKLRRLAKQQKDKNKALVRRKKEVAPTAAFRAAMNPHKVPRTGGGAPEEEVRFLSRGQKKSKSAKKSSDATDEGKKEFFVKWKKQKVKRIGKGL